MRSNWAEPQSRAGTQLRLQSLSSPCPQPLHVAGLMPGWALRYTPCRAQHKEPIHSSWGPFSILGTTCVSPVPGGLPKLPPGPQLSHPWQGVKEFKCEVCGREFTLQANMKRHMLIHTSVRPYQCHICFKTFVQKQTLKTHMIVHSPVKPFKCKVPVGLGG